MNSNNPRAATACFFMETLLEFEQAANDTFSREVKQGRWGQLEPSPQSAGERPARPQDKRLLLFPGPRVSHLLRSHAFFYPTLEEGNAILGPRIVAGHAAVENAGINLFGLSFNVGEGRKVEPVVLHRVNVGRVTEQRADIFSKAEGHFNTSRDLHAWAWEVYGVRCYSRFIASINWKSWLRSTTSTKGLP